MLKLYFSEHLGSWQGKGTGAGEGLLPTALLPLEEVCFAHLTHWIWSKFYFEPSSAGDC